jgi:uncharacterized protein (DUF1810 family)
MLSRFLDAQSTTYSAAYAELAAGRKRTHWMWFIFPQIHGLGSSPTARHYAIQSLDEAVDYLAHPLLGERLRTCTALVLAIPDPSLDLIFGYPDNLKFHSSVTLFAAAARQSQDPADAIFQQAIDRLFSGQPDPATLHHINVPPTA